MMTQLCQCATASLACQAMTRTTLVLDTPTYQKLGEVARSNERSIAAELRVAVREHVRAHVPAVPTAHKLAGIGTGEVGGVA
jgi:hypothetical protein